MTDLIWTAADIDPLTEREQDILALLVAGQTNNEIAAALHLAPKTVKWYNTQIYEKLHVRNREEAAERAVAVGLVTPDTPDITTPNNLPVPTTPFIGRATELRELSALLGDIHTRTITVTGSGGMGKTRLVTELARRQLPHYADGVYLVELAPLTSASAVMGTIGETIGFMPHKDSTDQRTQFLNYLHARSMLLVLDNFEHLLDAATLISDIAASASGVKLVVTSRERLNLTSEIVYSLSGMRHDDDSVHLFLQSARRIRPDFTLVGADYPHLAAICRMVEGMPLALELAAGWLDVLPLAEIAREIQQGIDILETELRDLPARHRSVRATIQQSVARLSDAEQTTFMKLSVFRGGFTLDAAQQVAGATLRGLRQLVNQSLITAHEGGRYTMHELIRQYAAEMLEQAGVVEVAQHTHMAYYADLLANITGRGGYTTEDHKLSGNLVVEPDFDNVVKAWRSAYTHGHIAALDQMLDRLLRYTQSHRLLDGIDLMQSALDHLPPDPDDATLTLLRGELMDALGNLWCALDAVQGAAWLQQAIDIFEALDATDKLIGAYASLGDPFYNGIHIAEGYDYLTRAYRLAQALNDVHWLAYIRHLMALERAAAGALDEGLAYARESLALAENTDEPFLARGARWALALVYVEQGKDDDAERTLLDIRSDPYSQPDVYMMSMVLIQLAAIAVRRGDMAAATAHIDEHIRLHERTGNAWQILGGLFGLANDLLRLMGWDGWRVTLLTVIRDHPFAGQNIRGWSVAHLNSLRETMDAEVYAAASARGQTTDYQAVIRDLRAELQTTVL